MADRWKQKFRTWMFQFKNVGPVKNKYRINGSTVQNNRIQKSSAQRQ